VVRREPERCAAVAVRTVARMGADRTTADGRAAAGSTRQVPRDFAEGLAVTPRHGARVRRA
jgi:hypothetical protein